MGLEIQWPLVLFTLVAGHGGGMLVPIGFTQMLGKPDAKKQFIAIVVSLVLLVVGGCFSLLHLASPQNVMAAIFNLFSFSGISIELILLGLCVVIAVALAVLLKKEVDSSVLKVFAVLGIIAGVLLVFFCGHGYVMVSRPLWNTNLLPLAYMGTSLAGGVFAYAVVLGACAAKKTAAAGEVAPAQPTAAEDCHVLKMVILVCSVICAITCAAYAIAVIGGATELSPFMFWAGIVLCGIVLMLMMGVYAYRKMDTSNLMTLSTIGLVIAVIAIVAVRIVMWDTSLGYLELFNLASIGSQIVCG